MYFVAQALIFGCFSSRKRSSQNQACVPLGDKDRARQVGICRAHSNQVEEIE